MTRLHPHRQPFNGLRNPVPGVVVRSDAAPLSVCVRFQCPAPFALPNQSRERLKCRTKVLSEFSK